MQNKRGQLRQHQSESILQDKRAQRLRLRQQQSELNMKLSFGGSKEDKKATKRTQSSRKSFAGSRGNSNSPKRTQSLRTSSFEPGNERRSQSFRRSSFAPGNGSRRYRLLAKEALKRETVSNFVSMPGFFVREEMKNISLMRPLHEGIPVLKLSTSGKLQKRVLTLSSCQQALFLTHSKVAPETKACMLKTPFYTPSRGFGKKETGNYLRFIDVGDLEGFCVGVICNQLLEENVHTKNVPSFVTIFHQEYFGRKYTNLLIQNSAHRMGLIAALQLMKRTYEESQQWVSRSVLLMRYIWYDVDRDISQLVTKEQFARICARINLNVNDAIDSFRDFLHKENIAQSSLTYGECMRLMEDLQSKNVVNKSIWKKIFGKAHMISAKSLLEFLHNIQGERDSDLTDAKDLISILNHIEMPPDHALVDVVTKLDKARFFEYLRSPLNDAFDPSHQELPTTKLTKPISHYWINSSHNTYLTGDQLKSKSSVEAYLNALRRGCKCLELDCWDGQYTDDGLQVDVYHGHTLTTKISFLSVILLVNNYLISNPDSYPIILSLENHCSPPYQNHMADTLKRTLGNKLFIPTPTSRKEEMPSPESLKGRVLVKAKRPPEPDGDNVNESKKNDPPEYAKSLKDLIYFHGTTFESFEDSCDMAPSNMHSIGESNITAIAEKSSNSPFLWRKYNVDHITRTYPAGIRVASSNYNPVFAWSLGCQMVALNFQTSDTNMVINDGRFRQNGACGYILKPSSAMNGKKPEHLAIKIRVLCASCLPKPNWERRGERIDPYYVQVELHDVRVRNRKEEYYTTSHLTDAVRNNGYSPVWKDEGHRFLVHTADVAMVVFKVIDQVVDQGVLGDHLVACAAIPVTSLRQGFRSIQLYHYDNHRIGPYKMATLLVQIQKMKKSDKKRNSMMQF